ncbi:DUF1461 domain-containing protein [Candidatus Woesearchaeota archaeon]|nr:DUF1461 domain-containing protein [Candidatus Woesearchaeota archaeon]
MKKQEKLIFALAITCLLFVIIIFPLRLTLFNESYYHSQFARNNVQIENKEEVLVNLLNFFRGEEDLEYFSENEKSHLEDVKILLDKFFFLFYFTLFLFIVSLTTLFFINKKNFKENLPKILFLGGLSSFTVIILLLLASFNFSVTFDGFHKLFFSQGNYSFSSTSLLISLFSESFFKSFFLRMIFNSLILSIIFMVPQLALNRMRK